MSCDEVENQSTRWMQRLSLLTSTMSSTVLRELRNSINIYTGLYIYTSCPSTLSQTTLGTIGLQQSTVPMPGGGGPRGLVLPAGISGGGGGGSGAAAFLTGGGLLQGKSMISMQSKRLADDVNYVYDRQILYTNKIQFQRSRIEDLTFRIAKADKELVSAAAR